jgi:hypothetical protein
MRSPLRAVRGQAPTIAGYLAGKGMPAQPAFDVYEPVVDVSRVAVRATRRGTLARDLGRLEADAVARVAPRARRMQQRLRLP